MQAQIECLCEGGASEQRPLKDFSLRQVPLAIEARCESYHGQESSGSEKKDVVWEGVGLCYDNGEG